MIATTAVFCLFHASSILVTEYCVLLSCFSIRCVSSLFIADRNSLLTLLANLEASLTPSGLIHASTDVTKLHSSGTANNSSGIPAGTMTAQQLMLQTKESVAQLEANINRMTQTNARTASQQFNAFMKNSQTQT